jgi:chromosome segregation ATPase
MSRPTALLMSSVFTLFLLSVMVMVVWTTRAAVPSAGLAPATTTDRVTGEPLAAYQPSVEQAQADMAAREAQYKARLAELEQLAQQRANEFQARLDEAATQLSSCQAQVEQSRRGLTTYLTQATQLKKALDDRTALFAARRQEFESQRQTRLAELQNQLDQGRAKLQEANAQLGR